jgi:hypothetical protein
MACCLVSRPYIQSTLSYISGYRPTFKKRQANMKSEVVSWIGGNPAPVAKRTSSPLKITFTRSDRYLITVPERIRCILTYLYEQCGLLDDRTLYRQNGMGQSAKWAHRQTVQNIYIDLTSSESILKGSLLDRLQKGYMP